MRIQDIAEQMLNLSRKVLPEKLDETEDGVLMHEVVLNKMLFELRMLDTFVGMLGSKYDKLSKSGAESLYENEGYRIAVLNVVKSSFYLSLYSITMISLLGWDLSSILDSVQVIKEGKPNPVYEVYVPLRSVLKEQLKANKDA